MGHTFAPGLEAISAPGAAMVLCLGWERLVGRLIWLALRQWQQRRRPPRVLTWTSPFSPVRQQPLRHTR